MNKKTKTIIGIVGGALLLLLVILLLSETLAWGATQISFMEFTNKIGASQPGEITSISCNAFVWEMTMANGERFVTNGPSVHYYADWASFVESIGYERLKGIQISLSNPNESSLLDYLFPALSVGIGLILLLVLFRQMSGGRDHTMGIGKSKAHVQSNLKVRFSDVAGAEEEKEELKEIVEFLKAR